MHDIIAKWVATMRDGFALLRDFALFLLLALLILAPTTITDHLQGIGVKKVEAMGVTWEAVQEAAATTGDVQQQLESMKGNLDSVQKTLASAAQTATTPAAKAEIVRATRRLDTLQTSIGSAEAKLNISRTAQERVLETVSQSAPRNGGLWGVVVGADKTALEARTEVRAAEKRGFSKVTIYSRDGWFRTVAIFDSRDEAESASRKLRTSMRSSAYIVDLDEWCPGGRLSRDGIVRCD